MIMLELKKYQVRVLDSLKRFLNESRKVGPSAAFIKLTNKQYIDIPSLLNLKELEGMPYICFRVPTGGGKTLIASHSIGVAMREYLQRDRSLVLWVVPSTQILTQTISALKNKKHPYRKAIEETIQGPVSVFSIEEALAIPKVAISDETCIIVTTLQALRVKDTIGRRVYSDNGYLMSHFSNLKANQLEKLEKNEDGVVINSLANVIKLNRPIVIMDEAHNARTKLSFDTIARLNPSCVIELTATPQTEYNPEKEKFASNVLWSVSAAELNAESMIKMPIRVETHASWKQAVSQAIGKRRHLEDLAQKEYMATGEYIRPILLLQAQNDLSNKRTINVNVLKQTLIEDFKIPEDEIAIHAGDTREIQNIDLMSPSCKIRFIITVKALQEGWDCPFAYVLCSVADISSNTAVEQLLGRILRLPNVKKKKVSDLNKAYVYVSSQKFKETVDSLKEALVQNGFERFEASTMIVHSNPKKEEPVFVSKQLSGTPNFDNINNSIRSKIFYNEENKTIEFRGRMSENERLELEKCFDEEEDKQLIFDLFTQSQFAEDAIDEVTEEEPENFKEEKEKFEVPYLAYLDSNGNKKVFEETLLKTRNWDILSCPHELTEHEFSIQTKGAELGEINISSSGKIETVEFIAELDEQFSLDVDNRGWTAEELAGWLDRRIPHPDISIKQSKAYILKIVNYLLVERNIPLEVLISYGIREELRKAIERFINKHRQNAKKKNFEQLVDINNDFLLVDDQYCFTFDPDIYPANWYYTGHYTFQKHYYDVIGELKDSGEEFRCAQEIDSLPEVKYWVRNLASQEKTSFWFQLSSGRFYPDFIAKLNDGRILIVEYKGEHIMKKPDTDEKVKVGEVWAKKSNGKCLFYLATKDNIHLLGSFIKQN